MLHKCLLEKKKAENKLKMTENHWQKFKQKFDLIKNEINGIVRDNSELEIFKAELDQTKMVGLATKI